MSAKRVAILGWAILLPVACAQGVQDNAPPEGFGSAATGDIVDSGGDGSTSAGGNSSAASAGAGQSAGVGASGSSSGAGSTTNTGGSGAADSETSGDSSGGNASGGASAGASSAGKGGGSLSGGSSSGGSPSAGSPSAGSSAGGAAAGGKGGSGMGGSSAGAASAGAAAGGATGATGFYVQYLNMKTASSSPYISCELRVINNGTSAVAVNTLKVRYYLTNDPMVALQMTNNFQHIAIPGNQADLTVTNTVVKMPSAVTNADTYIEFSFSSSSHQMLASQEVLEYAWQVQGPDPSKDNFTQSNDYSWDGTNTALATWDHVVALQGSGVIWGTPPQ